MRVLWVAYRTDTNANPFGRDMVGYAGWHESQADAMAAAQARYPDVPADVLQVNRA